MRWVKYHNGNYDVYIDLDTGTKIRKNELDNLTPSHPESMDIKITNRCKHGCVMCHENSTKDGLHGDIMNAKFIETLLPYTELAINGNDMSHPDLIPFLMKLREKKVIANLTVKLYAKIQDDALYCQEIIALFFICVNPLSQFLHFCIQIPIQYNFNIILYKSQERFSHFQLSSLVLSNCQQLNKFGSIHSPIDLIIVVFHSFSVLLNHFQFFSFQKKNDRVWYFFSFSSNPFCFFSFRWKNRNKTNDVLLMLYIQILRKQKSLNALLITQ